MNRNNLLEALDLYSERWVAGRPTYSTYDFVEEQAHCLGIQGFVRENKDCFERSCRPGHITASALVVSPNLDFVLLTLHAKLNKWLQLGGHCDGESDTAACALREAREESGRHDVRLLSLEKLWPHPPRTLETPFDCDIHAIPERKGEPAHFHYDVRYLCVLDPHLPLAITAESKDLRWLSMAEAKRLTAERSMQRQFDKLTALMPYLR